MMNALPHRLDRTVVIQAKPETVFRFFTDSERWARWWGAGSTIEAKPGGKVYIRHPNGIEVLGEVLEIVAGERIAFTYGFATGKPIAAGASRVTIRIESTHDGTRLTLTHEFAEAAPRDEHIQGWRFQLSLFANIVADEVHSGAAGSVDTWFSAWNITDDKVRQETLTRIVVPTISFRDRFSLLEGIDDLTAHAGAAQRFMPGMRLQRKGGVRHCQGTLLADWVAVSNDGAVRMAGTSVFQLAPDGKMASITSLADNI